MAAGHRTADERDQITLRTNVRGETVQPYRTLGTADNGRELLLDFVAAINALAREPRWYTALTHDCTTSIWHRMKAIGSGSPLDWRLLANGHLVDLAYERGTVNTRIGRDEMKQRSDITARARAASGLEDFSRAIREGLPARPAHGPANAAVPAPRPGEEE